MFGLTRFHCTYYHIYCREDLHRVHPLPRGQLHSPAYSPLPHFHPHHHQPAAPPLCPLPCPQPQAPPLVKAIVPQQIAHRIAAQWEEMKQEDRRGQRGVFRRQ